jgi:hypothetical protein
MSTTFIKERQNVSGVDYARMQREQGANFIIMRLSDGAQSYRDRLPRADSKFWSHNFVVWDVNRNAKAVKS